MNQCVMCGAATQDILCEKCDKPLKRNTTTAKKSSAQVAEDPFPKAPVVPFPVETTSVAATSVCEVLMAAKVPGVLLGADRLPKFCTPEARILLSLDPKKLPELKHLESLISMPVPSLKTPFAKNITVGSHKVLFSVVPLSGGSGGAVLILRPHDPAVAMQNSFLTYAEETIVGPLGALRDSLAAAARRGGQAPIVADAAGTIDQILGAFELAPGVEMTDRMTQETAPSINDVVRRVGDRFTSVAARKKVLLQIDAGDTDETFKDHHNLEEVLVVFMENSLHYTPEGGQIVLGLRTLEHKGRPLLLFFVMDSGPRVPEQLRESIFDAGFSWQPNSTERGGRSLSRCKDFATTHGGSVWVESKSGKACTFFLRVRPDGAM